MPNSDEITKHYTRPDLYNTIIDAISRMGKTPEQMTAQDLAAIDEFHLCGPLITDELISKLKATEQDHILDIGSGLGGPARHLAASTGARVTGIDLTQDYNKIGTAMTQWTGLESKVSLIWGDAANLEQFDDATFDAAWTLHVAMNIADKPSLYNEAFRVLKPGAKFICYDILAVAGKTVHYPMPWAQDEATSFLLTQEEMAAALTRAQFSILEVEQHRTRAIEFLRKGLERQKQMQQDNNKPTLGLPLLFGEKAKTIFPLMLRNLEENNICPTHFLCQKPF